MTRRDWMVDANCLGVDPELFFPSTTGNGARQEVARAAVVCRECPVVQECRDYADALHVPFGVWHGQARSGPLPPISLRPVAPHGTEAAARRHQRRGEKPCPACRDAAAWARRHRDSRGA